MGGPVTQLLARRHPDRVAGFVLCATASDWSDLRLRVFWRTMTGLRLLLGLFPRGVWRTAMRLAGARSRESSWVTGELSGAVPATWPRPVASSAASTAGRGPASCRSRGRSS
jgi:pimeloyl-ACP methyl ester carboxylesterase